MGEEFAATTEAARDVDDDANDDSKSEDSVVVSEDGDGDGVAWDQGDVEVLGQESGSSTDDDDLAYENPVGDVPMKWYEGFGHIGYDREGRRIERKAGSRTRLGVREEDSWRVIEDEKTGEVIELTDEELLVLDRIRRGVRANGPVEDEVVAWTGEIVTGPSPLPQPTEPKRRFLPSKHEAQRVLRIVRAIRNGWVKIGDAKASEEKKLYDLWQGDGGKTLAEMTKAERARELLKAPPPKAALPSHDESYNPPPEYLPTPDEAREWKENPHPEDRTRSFLPQKYDSMRHVPGFKDSVRERFERCLDLYLAVRVRKQRMNIEDPSSLLPTLPDPRDLRPFPTKLGSLYGISEPHCESIAVHPGGQWLLTGSSDGNLRVYEVGTTRRFALIPVGSSKDGVVGISSVSWLPRKDMFVCAVTSGKIVLILSLEDSLQIDGGRIQKLLVGGEDVANSNWIVKRRSEAGRIEEVEVAQARAPKWLTWHSGGDYFATINEDHTGSSAVLHRISSGRSHSPFKGKASSGLQTAEFHPNKPFFFLATKRHIRIFDLAKQTLIKKLTPGLDWITSIAVHPSGDHVLVSSHDQKLCWFDLDMTSKPYRIIHNHSKSIRKVLFHPRLPLFADASDDGSVHVFHATVYEDLMRDPLIVPVKILDKIHSVTASRGICDVAWHPSLPWLFTSGADGKIALLVH